MEQVLLRIGESIPVWEEWKVAAAPEVSSRQTRYQVCRMNPENGQPETAVVNCLYIGHADDLAHARQKKVEEDTIRGYFNEKLRRADAEVAKIAAISQHPNIERILAHAILPGADGIGGTVFILTEALPTLLGYFSGRRITKAKLLSFTSQICDALEACRAAGVLHRNIRPQCLFATEDGVFKLGRFDYAFRAAEGVASRGLRGQYAAPELIRGETYDSRADIYALGMVLYMMSNAGCTPFLMERGADAQAVSDAMNRRLSGEAFPPPRYRDPDLERIIGRACAFDPAQRYQRPSEMKQDAVAWLTAMAAHSRAAKTAAPQTENPMEATMLFHKVPAPPAGASSPAAAETSSEITPNPAPRSPQDSLPAAPAKGKTLETDAGDEDIFAALMTDTAAADQDKTDDLSGLLQNDGAIDSQPTTAFSPVGQDAGAAPMNGGTDTISFDALNLRSEAPNPGQETMLSEENGEEDMGEDGEEKNSMLPVVLGSIAGVALVLILVALLLKSCNQGQPTGPSGANTKDSGSATVTTDPPPTESQTDAPFVMPDVIGKTQSEACDMIIRAGFKGEIGVEQEEDDSVAAGTVLAARYSEDDQKIVLTISVAPAEPASWSEWLTKLPENVTETEYLIESKTQYTYRTLNQTTSTQDELKGWTRDDDKTEIGDWSEWGEWGDEKAEESDSLKVESRVVYRYRLITGTHKEDWTPWGTEEIEEAENRTIESKDQYRVRDRELKSSETKDDAALIAAGYTFLKTNRVERWSAWSKEKPGDDVPEADIKTEERAVSPGSSSMETWYSVRTYVDEYVFVKYGEWKVVDGSTDADGWCDEKPQENESIDVQTRKVYRSQDEVNEYGEWSEWSTEDPAAEGSSLEAGKFVSESKTTYRSATRTITYHFTKWGSWSNWTDTAYTETETRQIATRLLYRYKKKQ